MKSAFAGEYAGYYPAQHRRQKTELPRGESKDGLIAFQRQVGDAERRARIGAAQCNIIRIRIRERGALAAHLHHRFLGGDLHRERKS